MYKMISNSWSEEAFLRKASSHEEEEKLEKIAEDLSVIFEGVRKIAFRDAVFGDERAFSQYLSRLGTILLKLGDDKVNLKRLYLKVKALSISGDCCMKLERLDEAIVFYRQVKELCSEYFKQEVEDTEDTSKFAAFYCSSLNNWAKILMDNNDNDLAFPLVSEAMPYLRHLGSPGRLAVKRKYDEIVTRELNRVDSAS